MKWDSSMRNGGLYSRKQHQHIPALIQSGAGDKANGRRMLQRALDPKWALESIRGVDETDDGYATVISPRPPERNTEAFPREKPRDRFHRGSGSKRYLIKLGEGWRGGGGSLAMVTVPRLRLWNYRGQAFEENSVDRPTPVFSPVTFFPDVLPDPPSSTPDHRPYVDLNNAQPPRPSLPDIITTRPVTWASACSFFEEKVPYEWTHFYFF